MIEGRRKQAKGRRKQLGARAHADRWMRTDGRYTLELHVHDFAIRVPVGGPLCLHV